MHNNSHTIIIYFFIVHDIFYYCGRDDHLYFIDIILYNIMYADCVADTTSHDYFFSLLFSSCGFFYFLF